MSRLAPLEKLALEASTAVYFIVVNKNKTPHTVLFRDVVRGNLKTLASFDNAEDAKRYLEGKQREHMNKVMAEVLDALQQPEDVG